jgi:hypothetical protein
VTACTVHSSCGASPSCTLCIEETESERNIAWAILEDKLSFLRGMVTSLEHNLEDVKVALLDVESAYEIARREAGR